MFFQSFRLGFANTNVEGLGSSQALGVLPTSCVQSRNEKIEKRLKTLKIEKIGKRLKEDWIQSFFQKKVERILQTTEKGWKKIAKY